MFLLIALLAYTILLAAAFRRWRLRGAALAIAGAIFVNVAIGTFHWSGPHVRSSTVTSNGQDWACNSINALPAILLVGAVVTLALRLLANARATVARQLAVAVLAAALAAVPAMYLSFYWVIQALSCDYI